MDMITEPRRNGVDTAKLKRTLDAMRTQPDSAHFQFRAHNQWIDGAHNRSTIKDFHPATRPDLSRSEPFELDAGQPTILAGENTGATPAEHLLHALAACLTTTLVYLAAARRRTDRRPNNRGR
jgi:organic hydroperoxide reductase OsmC/OhrA